MIEIYDWSKKSERAFPIVSFKKFFKGEIFFTDRFFDLLNTLRAQYLQGLEEHTLIFCWKTAVFSPLHIKNIGAWVSC